jgi:hypothetical protein
VDKQKELLKTALINNWKNVYSKEERAASEDLQKLNDFYSN